MVPHGIKYMELNIDKEKKKNSFFLSSGLVPTSSKNDKISTTAKNCSGLSVNQQSKVLVPVLARSKQYFFWLTLVVQVSLPHVF